MNRSVRSKLTGTGMYVPERVVTNADLAKLMDTTDEWIQQRTGIKERRYITPGQTPVDLAGPASEMALEAAGLKATDLDFILLATLSPQHEFPGTSFFLHERLEAETVPCIDLRAQCSGFLYALNFADGLIQSRKCKRVLVVGCELHSTGIDLTTRGRDVAVIFGDGAGAVVLEANEDEDDPRGLLDIQLHAQGKHARRLWIEAPASGHYPVRIDHQMIEEGRHFPQMEGRYVFKNAVTRMPEVMLASLEAASIKIDDVGLFLFHQANLRINEFVAQKMEIPEDRVLNNIQRYGNCSAASIPMLLAEASQQGRLEPGQIISMTAFGSGFTWGSAVLRC
ncbi:MAG: beta-ketoacyl-ACP synthase III [Myxococcota bacterium]|nr:beta-ketoacyl-ACP synthase III [Myxococcota bacterium]